MQAEKEAQEESARLAREEREAAASALVDVANEAVSEIAPALEVSENVRNI